MRKSIKKFLIISQLLGWSALVTSACTDDQVKNTMQSNVNNNAQDSGTNKQKDDSQERPDNQVVKLTKVGSPLTYTLSEGHPPADGPKPNGEKNMNTAGDHQEDKVNNAEGSSVTSSSGGESGHNPSSGPTNNPQANPQASQKSEPAGGKGMGGSDGSHQGQAEGSSSEGSIPGAGGGGGQKGDAKVTAGQESTHTPPEPKKET